MDAASSPPATTGPAGTIEPGIRESGTTKPAAAAHRPVAPGSAQAYLALATMPVFFGLSFVGAKIALRGFEPLQLALVRFVFAGGILYGLWRLRPHREKLTRTDLRQLALVGFVSLTVYFAFETTGIARTSAAEASVLIAAIPVFVSLLSAFVLKERIGTAQWCGVALSFAGVIGLVLAGQGTNGGTITGDLLVLGAAVSAAAYQIMARRFLAAEGGGKSALCLTAFQNLFGAAFMLPLAALEAIFVGVRRPTVEAGAGVAYLILFCSVLAYLLLNFGLRRVSASRASTFTNLTPFVAVIGAYFILGERLSIWQGVAALVVIAGVWLANRRGVAARTVRSPEAS